MEEFGEAAWDALQPVSCPVAAPRCRRAPADDHSLVHRHSTPFAVTLNDDNPALKKWLPPTDCRLRPDQHAFEKGKFEHANNLKTELEEHQRTTRRAREKGELPPHKARWFTRTKDQDTGESYWQPSKTGEGLLEYWEERTRVGQAKERGEQVEWKEVDPICEFSRGDDSLVLSAFEQASLPFVLSHLHSRRLPVMRSRVACCITIDMSMIIDR